MGWLLGQVRCGLLLESLGEGGPTTTSHVNPPLQRESGSTGAMEARCSSAVGLFFKLPGRSMWVFPPQKQPYFFKIGSSVHITS